MRKAIAPIAIAAALGGAFGAIAFGPAFAGAQDDTTTTTVQEDSGSATDPGSGSADTEVKADGRIADALAPLVEDGTITQEQADAVTRALRDALPKGPWRHLHIRFEGIDAAADYLGLTKQELFDALADGKTLATIAGEQNKPVDDLIDAMVAAANEKIDEAVANGRIDEDRAAEMKSNLEERVTEFVNEGHIPPKGDGFRGRIRERIQDRLDDSESSDS